MDTAPAKKWPDQPRWALNRATIIRALRHGSKGDSHAGPHLR
jgi:hypothetical protein